MLTFKECQKDQLNELVHFLTSEPWHFHGQVNPSKESISSSFQKGFYTENGNRTFWVSEDGQIIGIIRLFDLEDLTCLFDIRFRSSSRGKGLGVEAIKWIAEYVFINYSHIHRVEGHTRQDNFAMRKTFYKAGYIKEAYHRESWPQNGSLFDSVGYAMTRHDWENKTVTIIMDDFPY
ncbi:GNAT family N-acetyltransferase [Neobacillus sp. D3-1R]|uniref:GNAT family N-acetyltransferase n=1 Tax=Neobacillus sp. D3-1R TaxID=3445778 RepID=UPI003F9FF0C5